MYYSLPDFIIHEILRVRAKQEAKEISKLVYEHHKLNGKEIEDTTPYKIRYRRFYAMYPPECRETRELFYKEPEPLHHSLVPKVHELDELNAKFTYDMDKLKNFLSYVVRYALSHDLVEKYIPSLFLEKYPSTLKYPGEPNPPELYSTIESKFKEEIPLLKKYFLMVKLHEME